MNELFTSHSSHETQSSPVIAYGLDDSNKPRAGLFDSVKAPLAKKAAEAMKLQVAQIISNELAEIASQLAMGRVYERGKRFIPLVRRSLYDKLLLAVAGKSHAKKGGPKKSASKPNLPVDWSHIQPGQMVIAHASAKDGWWEAVVMSVNGDMLDLSWRDYSSYPKFLRHRDAVALLKPAEVKVGQ
jgi:hypothetical protein